MDLYKPSFHAFMDEAFDSYLRRNNERIRSRIEGESEEYIIGVNEDEYADFLTEEFEIQPLVLKIDERDVKTTKVSVPAKVFPRSYNVQLGKSYNRDYLIVRIPYSGNGELFRCRPSTFLRWSPKVFLEDDRLCFGFVDFDYNADEITKRVDKNISDLRQWLGYLNTDIRRYNNRLRELVYNIFQARKQRILQRKQKLAAAGLPEKSTGEAKQTYSIPPPRIRKKIVLKPDSARKDQESEPMLDQSTYHDILKTIYDLGRTMEKHPSTYEGKNEEQLRDHILTFLEPGTEGSATGETFNKSGKTDILIRHEAHNVFVAECKFWRGEKYYFKGLDQLLDYLTWRDSKTAFVVFVQNKEFTTVLNKVEEITLQHSNCVRFLNGPEESWFNYEFSLPGDVERKVKVALLLFHFPPKKAK